MSEFMDDIHSVDRNKAAALLSIIPGLGHIYKHHYVSGFGLLIGGNILALWGAIILAPATLFLSLFIIPIYIGGMMATAYNLEDWRGRHHRESPDLSESTPETSPDSDA